MLAPIARVKTNVSGIPFSVVGTARIGARKFFEVHGSAMEFIKVATVVLSASIANSLIPLIQSNDKGTFVDRNHLSRLNS